MTNAKRPGKKHAHGAPKPANFVSGLAIVGLVVVSMADLSSANTIPNVVYFGLIGASLGAKFDDIARYIGGRR